MSITKFDAVKIGDTLGPQEIHLSKDQVRTYARTCGMDVPRFGAAGFDAGKDVEFVAPIRPGDKITLSSHVKEIYEKTGRSGSMVFVVVRSTVQNQKGEVVAHIDHRFMNRP